jgi:long-chain fatty acid transport protein
MLVRSRSYQEKIAALVIAAAFAAATLPDTATAAGFRIENQSLAAIGLSAARVAHTPGPDASYYNPANMGGLPDRWQVETSLTMLHLPSIAYDDHRNPAFNGGSDSELFLMPLLHIASPDYNGLRLGFSLTYPFGLAKQWSQPWPRGAAEEFSLTTVEANPTLSWQVADWLSVGGGVRMVYGKGEVKNTLTNPPFAQLPPQTSLRNDSDASDTSLGYNLALSVRPTEAWTIAATYRSEVSLNLSGHGNLSGQAGPGSLPGYSGPAGLDLTLPAVLVLATSYTVGKLTVELVWDRTYWSALDTIDLNFGAGIAGFPHYAGFDQPLVKNWNNADAYRIGLTYVWDDHWTTTLGFSYDETPVPTDTLGFELPDADALVYCAGVRYRTTNDLEFGISYMYHHTRSQSVTNANGIDGAFNDGGAHAVTIGLITTF